MSTINVIKSVQAHASKDKMFPILNAIHVTEDGYAEATDRFTMARAKLPEDHGLTPGLYSPSAVKILLAGGHAEPDTEGDFPNIARLLPTDDGAPNYDAGPVTFDPKNLAKFTGTKIPKPSHGAKHVTFTPGAEPNKPWLVTVLGIDREEWQALIIPIRVH